jgi:multicomponent K+:H+ antiporter subunit D
MSAATAWTAHALVLPLLLPMVAACLTLLAPTAPLRRTITIATTAALTGLAAWLVAVADRGAPIVYRLGDWPVPVAIVLVLDRLGALLLLLTAVVGGVAAWHAAHGDDADAPHVHALVLLLLAGLGGAFVAGDLFNLFVCFEILLIASYGLLVAGGTPARLRAGVHYVVLNLAGSSLFLIGIGMLYGVTGTLNLADLARRLAGLEGSDALLARSGGLVLLVVFALKAALVPLSFWLPSAYAAASPSVAALFALMTKVGVYAIIRLGTLLFPAGAGAVGGALQAWLLPAALATVAVGALAALGARGLRRLVAALLVASVGTMLAAIGLFSAPGVTAALYYLIHSTLAAAAMFLVAGLVEQRPDARAAVGTLFVAGGIAVAGLPPLGGFLGKVLILQAAPADAAGRWLWGLVLVASAFAVLAVSRRGAGVLWAGAAPSDEPLPPRPGGTSLAPASALLVVLGALSVLAGPVSAYAARTADQLLRPGAFVAQVLATPGGR